MAQEFVGLDRQQPVASPWLYGYGSVPEAAERVVSFVELSFWTGSRWQASSQLPDPQVGWVFVDSEGGHPAATYDRCVIRRWVSPVDGTVRLTGTLQHVPEQGNGVRARIFSSRHGQLGSWTAFHSSAATDLAAVDVQVGDTIDMVVDYQGQITHDEHLWHVHIDHSAGKAWDSRDDFRGGETNRWQMLVQALLMTNEFVYVD